VAEAVKGSNLAVREWSPHVSTGTHWNFLHTLC
jgi:hypothetical protein